MAIRIMIVAVIVVLHTDVLIPMISHLNVIGLLHPAVIVMARTRALSLNGLRILNILKETQEAGIRPLQVLVNAITQMIVDGIVQAGLVKDVENLLNGKDKVIGMMVMVQMLHMEHHTVLVSIFMIKLTEKVVRDIRVWNSL